MTAKKNTTKTTTENTTTETEFLEYAKTIEASRKEILTALDMAGGDFSAAMTGLKFAVDYRNASKKVTEKEKTVRAENKEKDRAELERIFNLAFNTDKNGKMKPNPTPLPGYLSSIRDEERYTKVKGEKVLANRLVGIRFERDNMDHCFQAFVPVSRKRGNIAKSTEEVEKDVENTLISLIKDVVLTHKD